jgi:hypothetical protein
MVAARRAIEVITGKRRSLALTPLERMRERNMQFSNRTVEAATALALTGAVEAQVGDPDGIGATWQALVRLDRTALLLHGVDDVHYPYVKPGTTTLMWLVDDNGLIMCIRSEDCDTAGHKERCEALAAEFAEHTRGYREPIDLSEFDDTDFSVNDFDDFDFEQEFTS